MVLRRRSKHILLIIFNYIRYFRKSIDWAKEYLKLQKAKDKELEELKQSLRLNTEFMVKNKELEKDLVSNLNNFFE